MKTSSSSGGGSMGFFDVLFADDDEDGEYDGDPEEDDKRWAVASPYFLFP